MHLGSRDEKTGIQALERAHPTHPMVQRKPEAVEHEYERHGTQTYEANFEVATGQVINPTVGDTRKKEDFVKHIITTVETEPQASLLFICDQLNTHKAATLAQAITQLCGIKDSLGIKGQSGMQAQYGFTCRFFASARITVSVLCIRPSILPGSIRSKCGLAF